MWRSGVYHINSNHIIISLNSFSTSQSENEIINNKEVTNFHENVINFLVFILFSFQLNFFSENFPKDQANYCINSFPIYSWICNFTFCLSS